MCFAEVRENQSGEGQVCILLIMYNIIILPYKTCFMVQMSENDKSSSSAAEMMLLCATNVKIKLIEALSPDIV